MEMRGLWDEKKILSLVFVVVFFFFFFFFFFLPVSVFYLHVTVNSLSHPYFARSNIARSNSAVFYRKSTVSVSLSCIFKQTP